MGALPIHPFALLTVLGAGLSVAALLFAVRLLLTRSDPTPARLRYGKRGVTAELRPVVLTGKSVPLGLASLARLAQGGSSRVEVRRQLVLAGLRSDSALQSFLAAKLVVAVALPIAFLAFGAEHLSNPDMAAPLAVVLCSLGFFGPNLWLRGKVSERQKEIERSLPDTMDLLVTCAEAGLALDAALSRVATETERASPVLAGELGLVFLEIQAGIPRVDAFRRLAERTGVEDLRSLAASLAQSEMFGTSISTALRLRSEWMRTRRMQQAEERAAVAAVKMTIPLVFCILPSLIAVVMGPAVVNVVKSLLPGLGGG